MFARDEVLELANGLTLSDFEPRNLRLWNGDTRDLAHGGPCERALGQRPSEDR